MKKKLLSALFMLVSIFAYAGKNQRGEKKYVLPSTLKEKDIRHWTMDDDGNFYYVFERDGRYYISGNENEIGPLESIPFVRFVPNYGLVYEIKENEKIFHSIGDKKLGPYDSSDWGICFSKNREHYFLIPKIGEEYFIVTDSQTFGPFRRKPLFTEIKDDGSVCYGISDDFKTEIFIDSKKIDEAFTVDFYFCGTDSFFYSKNEARPGTYSFYYDGKFLGPYEKIILLHLGGEPLWFCQDKGKNAVLMSGDKKCGELPFDISSSDYSMKLRRFGKNNYCFFSSYGKESEYVCLFDNEKLISYSYIFEKDGKKFVSFNNKEYGPYDNVSFSGITEDSVFWTVDFWSVDETPDEELSDEIIFDEGVPEGPVGVEGVPPFSYSRPHYGEKNDLSLYRNEKLIDEFKNCNDIFIDDLIANKKGDYVFEYNFHNLCVNGKVHAFDDDSFFLQGFVNGTSDFIAMTLSDSYTGFSLWKKNKFHKAIVTDDSVYYIDGDVVWEIKIK